MVPRGCCWAVQGHCSRALGAACLWDVLRCPVICHSLWVWKGGSLSDQTESRELCWEGWGCVFSAERYGGMASDALSLSGVWKPCGLLGGRGKAMG